MLRSLSLLEVKLEDVEEELGTAKEPSDLLRVGTDLRFVASSVFVPDGDPTVPLRPPEVPHKGLVRIQMPLRATALMYAEMLRIRAFFGQTQATWVGIWTLRTPRS